MNARRVGLLIVIVVAAFAVTLGIVMATRGGDDARYDDETRANFLEDCTADGGDDVAPACECWYDAIVEEIDYDRFEDTSSKLVAQADKDPDAEPDVPDDFLELLEPCRVTPTAETTTTTAPPTQGFSTEGGDTTTSAPSAGAFGSD